MKVYADTNFFTRLYLPLPDSPHADRLMKAGRNATVLPVTWLHRVELMNALELSVWLGRQAGDPMVNSGQAAVALATFREDVDAQDFLMPALLDAAELESQFEDLAQRHTAKHGFRTYDILHVASARLIGCDAFLTFDQKTKRLAALEGFAVNVRSH